MEVKYYQCKKCPNIFNEKLSNCPECGESKAINEDLGNTDPIFNICD